MGVSIVFVYEGQEKLLTSVYLHFGKGKGMRLSTDVKRYFQEKNTVALWWYPETSSSRHLYTQELQLVDAANKDVKQGLALDVACGKGRAAAALSGDGYRIVSLDISNEMLEKARLTHPNNILVQADGEALPFESERFDLVLCLEALVHFPSPQNAVREFSRVLKAHGRLILSLDQDTSFYAKSRRLAHIVHRVLNRPIQLQGQAIYRPLSTSQILRYLHIEGFRTVTVEYIGVLAPVWFPLTEKLHLAIISPTLSRRLHEFSRTLDKNRTFQRFAKYALIVAEKESDPNGIPKLVSTKNRFLHNGWRR